MKMFEKKSGHFFTRTLVLLFVALGSFDSNPVYAGEGNDRNANLDWPQWRGPNRDGISSVTGISKDWSTAAPKTLWRMSVGEGYSGLSVSNGRLLTMWDEGDSQFLVCLDALTGAELWRTRVGAKFIQEYGNGPRSTPAVHEGLVYAVSPQGLLYAANIENGQVRWTHDLAAEYGSQIPSIGYSSSPLVDEKRLFVEIGGKEGFAFAAFNGDSGELIWHSQSDLPAYSSPLLATVDGKRQVVFLSADGLFSVSPESGNLYWKYSWQTRCPATDIPLNAASPIFIAPDKIFVSSGYGTVSGAAVVQLQQAAGEFAVETRWTSPEMKNLINSSVLFEDHIYGFDGAILKCMDALTGEEKWKARGFQRGSLILAEGYLIVLGERGKLALVEATPDAFREVTSMQALDGKCWTSPTLANGKLYLRNQAELVCLDIAEK